MKAAKKEWTEEQCRNIKKRMMSGNSKEADNTYPHGSHQNPAA